MNQDEWQHEQEQLDAADERRERRAELRSEARLGASYHDGEIYDDGEGNPGADTAWDNVSDADEDTGLTGCECDNTHEQNDTVCRWCWHRGRRKPTDPEVRGSSLPDIYSPDCPSCLRGRDHTDIDHERSLRRQHAASVR